MEELLKEIAKRKEELAVLCAKLKEAELAELLPKMKEKYEGKFFKRVEQPESEDEYFVYYRVLKVETPRICIVNLFMVEKGGFQFSRMAQSGFVNLGEEITVDEYYAKLKEVKSVISRM